MRAMGQIPTDRELQDLIDSHTEGIDFQQFLSLMARNRDMDTEEELIEEFVPFDRDGSGLITIDDFRHHRPGFMGERLSPEEMEEIIREAYASQIIVENGRLDYIEFVRVMMAK